MLVVIEFILEYFLVIKLCFLREGECLVKISVWKILGVCYVFFGFLIDIYYSISGSGLYWIIGGLLICMLEFFLGWGWSMIDDIWFVVILDYMFGMMYMVLIEWMD